MQPEGAGWQIRFPDGTRENVNSKQDAIPLLGSWVRRNHKTFPRAALKVTEDRA